MNNKEKIIKLTKQLNEYRNAYYNNSLSLVEDSVYDSLFDELKKLEEEEKYWLTNSPVHSVGYSTIDKLNKITHNHPMLSLDKIHSAEEIVKFSNGHSYVLSLKMDGLSCSIHYKNGKLISAETRGDGEVGTDVYNNALGIENLPNNIPYNGELIIDGECIICLDDFEKINEALSEDKKYAHARNLASGSLSLLDSKIVAERHLKFIPWRLIKGFEDIDRPFNHNSFSDTMNLLGLLGFEVVCHTNSLNGDESPEFVNNIIFSLKELAETEHFPIDGIVATYEDMSYGTSLGNTSHHPLHSIAYKFAQDTIPAILKGVEWSVGRTGVVVPTAVFSTIIIDGTEVSRASIHNLSVMNELHLKKGCVVNVYKANQIIPQIESAENNGNEEIEIPVFCPSCGMLLKRKISDTGTETLNCENSNCPSKLLAKFVHFVSKPAMNIQNLSEATLEKLIGEGFIKTYKDIYHLDRYKDEIMSMDGFGKKSYDKLIKSIEDSRNVKLENYLVALGIDNIGKSASKTISKYFHGDYNDFELACERGFDFTQLEDFGQVMNDSIYKWFNSGNKNSLDYELQNLMYFIFEDGKDAIQNDFVNGKTFCITGNFYTMKRSEIERIITDCGGKLSGSVSKKTDFLLTNDADSGSSKAEKAKELNIPIVSEEDFIAKMKE